MIPQFPEIARIATDKAVGVKTCVGRVQYGNVVPLTKGASEDTKSKMLDEMEAELRRQITKQT